MKRYILIAAAAILTLGSCSPYMVKSDYEQSVNFLRYRTYSLRDSDLKINDIDRGRVLTEIRRQLQMKGLSEAANADLLVHVKASHKKVNDYYSTPMRVGYGWGGFGWGFGVNRVFSDSYNRGTLEIDLVDARSNRLVWQGIGSGINVDNPRSKQKQIPEVVAEILKQYPPQK
ncbi:MAG: DUF4136 domain-containing protein [Chryseobacterium sp.]|nr:MAG: DUF4136 domain-containing protein [Chryseobacterium sp.]